MIDKKPTILSITASDTGGKHGLQAAAKIISEMGAEDISVATAITAATDKRVVASVPLGIEELRLQLESVINSYNLDAIMVGYLPEARHIEELENIFGARELWGVPLVVDPVLIDANGGFLLDEEGLAAFKRSLVLYADILCLNIKEAECLTGMEIIDIETMEHAAEMLLTLGAKAVYLKGGQIICAEKIDLYASEDGEVEHISHELAHYAKDKATGTAIAAAVATSLAMGHSLREAALSANGCFGSDSKFSSSSSITMVK